MLTSVQWRQKLGLSDYRSDHGFFERGCCQTNGRRGLYRNGIHGCGLLKQHRIEEIIFETDGAAQLTKAWPRRVASAGWGVVVFGISHDGAHRRLLGAACAPSMLEGHFSTSAPSAPVAELTAAAAVGLLLEVWNSGAKLRCASWIADSTYALDVTTQRCRVNANTAMANLARGASSAVRRLSRVGTFHVRSHTGEPGNECADVLAELGRQGMRGSLSLVDRLLQCVHQRVARKPQVQELDL